MKVLCKKTWWEPARCKEEVEISFSKGDSYEASLNDIRCYIKNNKGEVFCFFIIEPVQDPQVMFFSYKDTKFMFDDYFHSENIIRKMKLEKLKKKIYSRKII